jgi:hypothetical protein
MPDSLFMGIPGGGAGGNPGGASAPVPSTGNMTTPAVGGQSNPLIPGFPGGTNSPLTTGFSANTGGTDPNAQLTAISGLSPSPPGMAAGGTGGGSWIDAIKQGFAKAGYPRAIGDLLAQFLAGGAGFNPHVVQSMLQALQPGIQRGEANIMEQFGAQGLRNSSSAAIGLGDFESQVTMNEGQILSQMYEQSVQNYMQVLMAGHKPQKSDGGMGSLIGGAGSAAAALIPAIAA